MKRIVVGVDGSEGARRALSWAMDEAARWGATLVAIHAWAVPVMAGPTGLTPLAIPDTLELQKAAEDFLANSVTEARRGRADISVEQLVVEAPAAEALLDAARSADLLVVGSRGHGGFVGLLLGSVSQHCAHHASCPVVVVPAVRDAS